MADRLDRFEGEFDTDRKSSSESRQRIHERIDEQAHRIGETEKTIVAAGATVAQQRDIITSLTGFMETEIKPTLKEWNRLKTLGWGMRMVLIGSGFGIGAFGTAFLWFGENIGPALRRWLPP
ncbi:hypothetical protein [Neorhizobium galegae]|uniref:hypothetical protein n=1 Tax=Neorhizobium galegae TaxID=399 RepID=UPI001F4687BA|nr:hypothetical protein [Neorhizobium galegae]UIK04922.1 hypothetical protein LZK81_20055 [Neorhizobium galegae]